MFNFNEQVLTAQDLSMLKLIGNTARKQLEAENRERLQKGLTPKKYTIVEIPLSLVRIDFRYQRKLNEAKINKIVANYDINKVKIKLGSFRDSSGIFLTDGYHTAEAKKLIGEDTIECKLFFDLTPEEEADYFADQLNDETKPSKIVRFRAHLFSGKAYAKEIKESIENHGYTLLFPGDKNTEGKNIKAITLIQEVYAKHGGKKAIDLMFDMFNEAGWDKYNETCTHVYLSMGKVINQILDYLKQDKNGTAYKTIIANMKSCRPSTFLGYAHTVCGDADNDANMHSDERALREYMKILAGVPQSPVKN